MKLNLSDFLKKSNDVSLAISTAIESAKGEMLELVFDQSEYHFDDENCINKVIYMTNTVSEKEMPIPNRKIGILIENASNVVLNGNGARLLYKGRLSEFVLLNCHNITITNFIIDFEIPTVAEFDVVAKGATYLDILPHPDCPYTIVDDKFFFLSDNIDDHFTLQECDSATRITRRINVLSWGKSLFLKQNSAADIGNGIIRINFAPTITMYFSEGKRYQACSSKRDASGTFMERCSDITLSGNTYHFMHGMGILAQLCNNLTVENCNFTPDYSRGRTTASFADMIHASMCKGLVKVVNCVFDGSRDDIINVHGNHFVIQKIKGNQMFVKFAHPQAYGFNAFDKGDIVEFVSPTTLLPIEQNEIVASELTSPRITKLTLKTAPSLKVKSGHCLENATNTASLYVDNIVGKNIPTRGILVTTRQSVVIKNSTFERLFMSGILMSDDAKGWYESGYVRDVTIDGNTFDNCLDLIVDIRPETKNLCCSKPVHKNILIKNNIIKSESPSKFFLKNVENVTFDHNTFEGNPNFIISKCHAKNITTIN